MQYHFNTESEIEDFWRRLWNTKRYYEKHENGEIQPNDWNNIIRAIFMLKEGIEELKLLRCENEAKIRASPSNP